jgi:hypothetical protein
MQQGTKKAQTELETSHRNSDGGYFNPPSKKHKNAKVYSDDVVASFRVMVPCTITTSLGVVDAEVDDIVLYIRGFGPLVYTREVLTANGVKVHEIVNARKLYGENFVDRRGNG